MSIFEYINNFTLSLIVVFYKLFPFINSKSKKVILCYHSVGNSGWRFATPVNMFNDQINFLKKNYKVVGLSEILDKNNNENCVSITFDDGYKDVYDNAMPILDDYKMTATVFVLGSSANVNRRELDNNLPLMSEDQIKILKSKDWEIGYHTNTHPDLVTLNESDLTDEIVKSKDDLEKKLDLKIKYFAYPKGKYNKQILSIIKKGKYKAAFTVDGGLFKIGDNLLITRTPMEGVMSIDHFGALLSPIGQSVELFFMAILVRKERLSKWINKLLIREKVK